MSHTKPILETVAITEPRTQSASCHIEEQCRGASHYHLTQQVPLQSSPPPTYEISLLQYWAASRPVARIFMATVADRRACRGLRATWALHCMAQSGQHDLASCRGCGHYPTYRTCAGCHINWCNACHTWSQLCWKCYRPRHELNDCGEFLPGRGVLEAMTDLSDDIEKLMRCTATEHASTQELHCTATDLLSLCRPHCTHDFLQRLVQRRGRIGFQLPFFFPAQINSLQRLVQRRGCIFFQLPVLPSG